MIILVTELFRLVTQRNYSTCYKLEERTKKQKCNFEKKINSQKLGQLLTTLITKMSFHVDKKNTIAPDESKLSNCILRQISNVCQIYLLKCPIYSMMSFLKLPLKNRIVVFHPLSSKARKSSTVSSCNISNGKRRVIKIWHLDVKYSFKFLSKLCVLHLLNGFGF